MTAKCKHFCGGVAHVINLPNRTDRLEKFRKGFDALNTCWKLSVEEAINGKIMPLPEYWTSGHGAWGCYRSHLRIIESALTHDEDGVMIFEDDAVFTSEEILGCPWIDYASACISELPSDWGFLYFGGQHKTDLTNSAASYSKYLHYAYSINRTHGYAISKIAMPTVYKHLLSRNWQRGHHIDHHLEVLHRSGTVPIFSAAKWLVSQGAGRSDITNRDYPIRTWQINVDEQADQKIIDGVILKCGTVGYGSIGLHGDLGYEDGRVCVCGADADWNWISAHPTSRLAIQSKQSVRIIGAVDSTGHPRSKISFRVDGQSLGELANPNDKTDEMNINPGTHILEIYATDNRVAHTVWGIK